MNAFTLNIPNNSIFRFFDDLVPSVPTQGDNDIKEGTEEIDNGDPEGGEAQVIKGMGEKTEENQ